MSTELFDRPQSADPPWHDGTRTEPATELVPAGERSLMSIIAQLAASDIDPEKLRQWFDLKREDDRNKAADAFCQAITEFQSRCGVIGKNRTAGQGTFGYKYASYEDVMAIAGPILKDCGLAISFSSEQQEKSLKVTCRVRKGIHFEDHTLTVPVPEMKVNDTQRMGAALKYAMRYALCGALNIVIGDEDNDAAKLSEIITDNDVAILNDWLSNTDTKLDRFLKWAGVDSLSNFPAAKMNEAIAFLKQKGRR